MVFHDFSRLDLKPNNIWASDEADTYGRAFYNGVAEKRISL